MKTKKKQNVITAWIIKNKVGLVCFISGVLISVLIMGALWPKRIATLANGEQVIVEIEGVQITADQLFNNLKSENGLSSLLQIIDDTILAKKYDLEKEALEYAKEKSEYYLNMYSSTYGYSKEEFFEVYGFKNEEDFFDYLKKDYAYQYYYKEYLKNKITESEIKDFYKKEVSETKNIYILSSDKKDNDLEKVRSALKKGTKLSDVLKKYPNVKSTKVENLNFSEINNYSDEFIEALKPLKKGKYSKVFEDSSYGYAVIYVSSVKEKENLENVRDEIKEYLAEELGNKDSSLYYQAFIDLRKEYGIKFHDTELEKDYNEFIKEYTTKSK